MWRHHPWLLALLLAPLLHGSVTSTGQVVAATLTCASLLLLAFRLENPSSGLARGWIAFIAVALLLPLLPLPASLAGLLSPGRLALAQAFPIDGETVPYLTLTVSPAYTAARLWNLLLCLTVFCLARAAAREPDGPRTLTLYLTLALCLLAGYDAWIRAQGAPLLPDLWPVTPRRGASTFANRNHYAGWVAAAILFVSGWILRAWFPLQSARGPLASANQRSRADGAFVIAGVTFAVLLVSLSGSRSGAGAFVAGLLVWGALLSRRSRRRSRVVFLGMAILVVGTLLLANSNELLTRLSHAHTDFLYRYPKLALWKQSLAIFANFPLLGTGWGTFQQAFEHFKNFGGDLAFLHAENDYVQLIMETGVLGTLAAAILVWHFGRRAIALGLHDTCAEPEAAFGALTALAALAAQSFVEFGAQIPALALLAAALAGLVTGSADPLPAEGRPVIPPAPRRVVFNLGWALALGLPTLCHGVSLWHWSRSHAATEPAAQAHHLRASLNWWPVATFRSFDLAGPETRLLATLPESLRADAAEAVHQRFNRLLHLDPLNAELHAQRAWFDLQHSTRIARTTNEVFLACRINPLNELTPLNLARAAAARDPVLASQILRSAPRSANHLREYLALAWELERNASALWPLVPVTTNGMNAIAEFALENKLPNLAATAWLRVAEQYPPSELAEKLLAARQPELVISLLPRLPDTPASRLLAIRAHLADRNYNEAITRAEAFWLARESSKTFTAPFPASLAYETARADWLADQSNPLAARRLAEKICHQPLVARDLNLLRTLAGTFPKELRTTWLLFSTLRDLGRYPEAATVATELALRAAERD